MVNTKQARSRIFLVSSNVLLHSTGNAYTVKHSFFYKETIVSGDQAKLNSITLRVSGEPECIYLKGDFVAQKYCCFVWQYPFDLANCFNHFEIWSVRLSQNGLLGERTVVESCASLQHDLKADTKLTGLFKRVPHSTEMLAVPCQLGQKCFLPTSATLPFYLKTLVSNKKWDMPKLSWKAFKAGLNTKIRIFLSLHNAAWRG